MIILNQNHSEKIKQTTIEEFYQIDSLLVICQTTIDTMLSKLSKSVNFPYFANVDFTQDKPFELDIYITDPSEGRQLNLEARQKDYATNILSYPSDLPLEVMQVLPNIMLGELVICHEVVAKQAKEQTKSVKQHLTHLIIHGILHLLGFDHELGENKLGISNPYE